MKIKVKETFRPCLTQTEAKFSLNLISGLEVGKRLRPIGVILVLSYSRNVTNALLVKF